MEDFHPSRLLFSSRFFAGSGKSGQRALNWEEDMVTRRRKPRGSGPFRRVELALCIPEREKVEGRSYEPL
jgi:hypothetical protein